MFDLGFTFERGGSVWLCFLIYDAYRKVAPRVRAAVAGLVFAQSFFDVFGDAGVQTIGVAEEDVDKPSGHGTIIHACLFTHCHSSKNRL